MSIVDALEMAARDSSTNGGYGLVGHALQLKNETTDQGGGDDDMQITPVDDGFPRCFVPRRVDANEGTGSENENENDSDNDNANDKE
jgi:hypothetical protein